MKAVRIYTGADKKSHFEDLDIPLKPGTYGTLSDLVPSEGVIFRETPAGGALDFHVAPRRQFVITLSGSSEVEVSGGVHVVAGPGHINLIEDTTGKGHITRNFQAPRKSLFIPLPASLDTKAWKV